MINYKFKNSEIGWTRQERITKSWWKPFVFIGEKLKLIIYKLHNIFGRKAILTERNYQDAKKFANENVSEKEYLRRFASINPYCQKYWSNILWWIRRNLTFQ